MTRKTKVIEGCHPDNIPVEVLMSEEPLILKGLVQNWPFVKMGIESKACAIDYLLSTYNGKLAGAYFGSPQIKGRYGYNDDLTGLDFDIRKVQLDTVLNSIVEHLGELSPPAHYVASNAIEKHFPTFKNHNDLSFEQAYMDGITPTASLWIGNRSIVPCHYDTSDNIACCTVGERRFTLFPPQQIHNLYPGPLELTPGGQAITMVDFAAPDFDKYPRFKEAQAAGEVANLEPGDALFIPSLWWHQVEGLSEFNVLVNYWWEMSTAIRGNAAHVLDHAFLSLRDLPLHQKQAWKNIFDYYIFGSSDKPASHLPEHAKGILGEIDDLVARKLRAKLLNRLNR